MLFYGIGSLFIKINIHLDFFLVHLFWVFLSRQHRRHENLKSCIPKLCCNMVCVVHIVRLCCAVTML